MATFSKITPCLWFDGQAEEAARFYAGIFPGGKITQVTHYTEAGHEIHGQPAGKVLTIGFELAGQTFTALNGGPLFKFSEAVSLQVMCDSQQEIDHYWDALTAGGDPKAQECGWLKDRFGVSWQVVPKPLLDMLASSDTHAANRAMNAVLKMKKPDVAALERAFKNQ